MGIEWWSQLRGAGRQRAVDAQGQLEALHRSQAVIEFTPEGHVISANARFLDFMGYSLAEIKDQHHRLFVHPVDADVPAYAAFWENLAEGQFVAGRFRRVTRSGQEVWLQATYNPVCDRDGRPVRIVKFASDVTADHARQIDAEGQLAAIGQVQAVIEFSLDGHVLHANGRFLQSVGYTLEEIQGRHHSLFVAANEAALPAYRAFWDKLRRGEYDAGQYRRVGKGGREIWIEASYNPIRDEYGRVVKVVKFATDITARVQAAAQLRAAIEGLAQTAASANRAMDEVRETSAVATRGAQAVSQVVTTMADISQRSQKIASIVGVIDSIAFQTNILALNAAVEAARAGPEGRGFAVVASEVRNLAQHSAAAASQIKTLIADSVQRIEAGTAVAGTAGATMQDILASVARVSDIMDDVAKSSVSQSAAMDEVSTVITRMNAAGERTLQS